MNDPVVNDEARHDRECQATEVLAKQARVIAQTAYEAGELDDWIEEVVDSHDSFKLAHLLSQWQDEFDQMVRITPPDLEGTLRVMQHVNKLDERMPRCSLRDFRANIEFVIEEKAKMIAEDL